MLFQTWRGELIFIVGSFDQYRSRGLGPLSPKIRIELERRWLPLARPQELGEGSPSLSNRPGRASPEGMRPNALCTFPALSSPERTQLLGRLSAVS